MNKFPFSLLLGFLVVPFAAAQTGPAAIPQPAQQAETSAALYTPDQLDRMLASIALYPDPLVALILPASTSPADIVLAARYLRDGGDPAQAESQPWAEPVQALARYAQIVEWMDQNLAWTKELGDAFAAQPDDVMAAIQRLRNRARAVGTLRDTAQQRVVYDGESIEILPAQPQVIYIPYYDPALAYEPPPANVYSNVDYVSFGAGFMTGWWLSYGFDWHDRCVWRVNDPDRRHFWRNHRGDWDYRARNRVVRGDRPPEVRTWHPRPEPGRPRRWNRPGQPAKPAHFVGIGHDVPRNFRPDGRRRDHFGEPSSGNFAANTAPFVGPTALKPVLPQPISVPRTVTTAPGPVSSGATEAPISLRGDLPRADRLGRPPPFRGRVVERPREPSRAPVAPPAPAPERVAPAGPWRPPAGFTPAPADMPPPPRQQPERRFEPRIPAQYAPPSPRRFAAPPPAPRPAPAVHYSAPPPPPPPQPQQPSDDGRDRRNSHEAMR